MDRSRFPQDMNLSVVTLIPKPRKPLYRLSNMRTIYLTLSIRKRSECMMLTRTPIYCKRNVCSTPPKLACTNLHSSKNPPHGCARLPGCGMPRRHRRSGRIACYNAFTNHTVPRMVYEYLNVHPAGCELCAIACVIDRMLPSFRNSDALHIYTD